MEKTKYYTSVLLQVIGDALQGEESSYADSFKDIYEGENFRYFLLALGALVPTMLHNNIAKPRRNVDEVMFLISQTYTQYLIEDERTKNTKKP